MRPVGKLGPSIHIIGAPLKANRKVLQPAVGRVGGEGHDDGLRGRTLVGAVDWLAGRAACVHLESAGAHSARRRMGRLTRRGTDIPLSSHRSGGAQLDG